MSPVLVTKPGASISKEAQGNQTEKTAGVWAQMAAQRVNEDEF